MKKLKVLQGAEVVHWMIRRQREKKPIALERNYIRIPARAWVEFQKIRNARSGRKQSLYEANKEFGGGR